MLLVLDRQLTSSGLPELPTGDQGPSRLNIVVIFTSMSATVTALKRAGTLAQNLSAQITLVVPQIVPYPLPLTSPPVLLDFQERRFHKIAQESPVDIRVKLYLCRNRREALEAVLKARSVVVVGGHKRFWPTREERLARSLWRTGHEVILFQTD